MRAGAFSSGRACVQSRRMSPAAAHTPTKHAAGAAPERSLSQRMDALKRANEIRTRRASLKRALLARRDDYELSVSATTRPPRAGEVDGRDYHFLTPEEFEHRLARGEFLEHAVYAGHLYGTPRSEVERARKNLVLEIEVQGARQVREALPEATQVFIAPPSEEALRARLG